MKISINIDNDMDKDYLENIDIDINIDMDFLENIDIDKGIVQDSDHMDWNLAYLTGLSHSHNSHVYNVYSSSGHIISICFFPFTLLSVTGLMVELLISWFSKHLSTCFLQLTKRKRK